MTEKTVNTGFTICILHHILLWFSNQGKIRWVGHVAHTCCIRNMYKTLSQNLKVKDNMEDLSQK
jgi:hypothetical protein